MNEAFLYEAIRTPFGRYGGALAGVRYAEGIMTTEPVVRNGLLKTSS